MLTKNTQILGNEPPESSLDLLWGRGGGEAEDGVVVRQRHFVCCAGPCRPPNDKKDKES
jgi:hypothetical protein